MSYLLHLLPLHEWREAGAGPLEPASLRAEGFVHASRDESMLLAVANAFYRQAAEPLVALVLDPDLLEAEVRWEEPAPAPPPGVADSALFPHIYGPVPVDAVVEELFPRRDPAGVFTGLERRAAIAEALDLLPHPEGGWFRQTWRTGPILTPEGYPGARSTATGIYFLLGPDEASRWHRVRSDEVWIYNRGGPLSLRLGGEGARPAGDRVLTLGPAIEAGQQPQVLVPSGTWQAANPASGEEVLVTCVVSPGFDFADFEVEP